MGQVETRYRSARHSRIANGTDLTAGTEVGIASSYYVEKKRIEVRLPISPIPLAPLKMKKQIQLNERDIIKSMREALSHAQGQLKLRVTKVARAAENSSGRGTRRRK